MSDTDINELDGMSKDQCMRKCRYYQLNAYAVLLEACRAKGILPTQLLVTMRETFKIPLCRHRAEMIRVFNDEKLSYLAERTGVDAHSDKEWAEESRRQVPMKMRGIPPNVVKSQHDQTASLYRRKRREIIAAKYEQQASKMFADLKDPIIEGQIEDLTDKLEREVEPEELSANNVSLDELIEQLTENILLKKKNKQANSEALKSPPPPATSNDSTTSVTTMDITDTTTDSVTSATPPSSTVVIGPFHNVPPSATVTTPALPPQQINGPVAPMGPRLTSQPRLQYRPRYSTRQTRHHNGVLTSTGPARGRPRLLPVSTCTLPPALGVPSPQTMPPQVAHRPSNQPQLLSSTTSAAPRSPLQPVAPSQVNAGQHQQIPATQYAQRIPPLHAHKPANATNQTPARVTPTILAKQHGVTLQNNGNQAMFNQQKRKIALPQDNLKKLKFSNDTEQVNQNDNIIYIPNNSEEYQNQANTQIVLQAPSAVSSKPAQRVSIMKSNNGVYSYRQPHGQSLPPHQQPPQPTNNQPPHHNLPRPRIPNSSFAMPRGIRPQNQSTSNTAGSGGGGPHQLHPQQSAQSSSAAIGQPRIIPILGGSVRGVHVNNSNAPASMDIIVPPVQQSLAYQSSSQQQQQRTQPTSQLSSQNSLAHLPQQLQQNPRRLTPSQPTAAPSVSAPPRGPIPYNTQRVVQYTTPSGATPSMPSENTILTHDNGSENCPVLLDDTDEDIVLDTSGGDITLAASQAPPSGQAPPTNVVSNSDCAVVAACVDVSSTHDQQPSLEATVHPNQVVNHTGSSQRSREPIRASGTVVPASSQLPAQSIGVNRVKQRAQLKPAHYIHVNPSGTKSGASHMTATGDAQRSTVKPTPHVVQGQALNSATSQPRNQPGVHRQSSQPGSTPRDQLNSSQTYVGAVPQNELPRQTIINQQQFAAKRSVSSVPSQIVRLPGNHIRPQVIAVPSKSKMSPEDQTTISAGNRQAGPRMPIVQRGRRPSSVNQVPSAPAAATAPMVVDSSQILETSVNDCNRRMLVVDGNGSLVSEVVANQVVMEDSGQLSLQPTSNQGNRDILQGLIQAAGIYPEDAMNSSENNRIMNKTNIVLAKDANIYEYDTDDTTPVQNTVEGVVNRNNMNQVMPSQHVYPTQQAQQSQQILQPHHQQQQQQQQLMEPPQDNADFQKIANGILNNMINFSSQNNSTKWFINKVEKNSNQYYKRNEPMWLNKIQGKLLDSTYSAWSEFDGDMQLMFNNCMATHDSESLVYAHCVQAFNLYLKLCNRSGMSK